MLLEDMVYCLSCRCLYILRKIFFASSDNDYASSLSHIYLHSRRLNTSPRYYSINQPAPDQTSICIIKHNYLTHTWAPKDSRNLEWQASTTKLVTLSLVYVHFILYCIWEPPRGHSIFGLRQLNCQG